MIPTLFEDLVTGYPFSLFSDNSSLCSLGASPTYFFLFFNLILTEPVLYYKSNTVLRIFTWVSSRSPDGNSTR